MPVTPDQAHMLTAIALACRPNGAPRWDAPGVMAAIQHVSQLALADVTKALIRLAEDAHAKTPGGLRDTGNPCWNEKLRPVTAPREPRTEEACRRCGKHVDHCACETAPVTRATPPNPRNHEHADAARALIQKPTKGEL